MDNQTRCAKCNSVNVKYYEKRQGPNCIDCGHQFSLKKKFKPLRIFISYGHDEYVALAERIRDDLKKRGHEAWFDKGRLIPRVDWDWYTEEGLDVGVICNPAGMIWTHTALGTDHHYPDPLQ
jgi:hypothetical protein